MMRPREGRRYSGDGTGTRRWRGDERSRRSMWPPGGRWTGGGRALTVAGQRRDTWGRAGLAADRRKDHADLYGLTGGIELLGGSIARPGGGSQNRVEESNHVVTAVTGTTA